MPFLIILILLLVNLSLPAQVPGGTMQKASVDVIVTDMQGKVTKGEQIFFKSVNTQKLYSGLSDASGRFSIFLPTGSEYIITVKSLTDTTRYGVIGIPAIPSDEEYTEPFRVSVKFEPARRYTLDNVHFDFGKSSLRPESFPELDELIHYMTNRETIRIEISGHTDNIGKDADNLQLSQARAEAIRQYVVRKGIDGSRIIAKGYGATQPVADNNTDAGRQKNRRTEVRIL